MLDNESGIIPGKVKGRLERDIVQHERTDDAIDDSDAKLVKVLRSQALRYAQQPLDVLAVGWIARVLRLGPVIVNTARQSLESQHTHAVSSHKRTELLRRERLVLSMYLLRIQIVEL